MRVGISPTLKLHLKGARGKATSLLKLIYLNTLTDWAKHHRLKVEHEPKFVLGIQYIKDKKLSLQPPSAFHDNELCALCMQTACVFRRYVSPCSCGCVCVWCVSLYSFLLRVRGIIKIKQMPADAPFKDYQFLSAHC